MSNTEYLDVFIDESQEHLQAINDHLLQFEKEPSNLQIIGELFRSAHTLKGMAATMGYEDLAHLTHTMENVLDMIRNDQLVPDTDVIDVIFDSVDDLEEMVVDISEGGNGEREISSIIHKLEAVQKGEMIDKASSEAAATTAEEKPSTEKNDVLNEEYDQFELTVLSQSQEQGYSAYQMKITLDEKTMLKAARVYMVFEILEQIGEVIKSTPPVEELEDEKFDFAFVVTLLTKTAKEEVKERVSKVSEIESIDIQPLNITELQQSVIQKEEESALKAKESRDFSNETSSTSTITPKKAEQKQAKKPAQKASASEANKTIRVNIERLDVLMNLFEELVIDRGRLEQIAIEVNNSELNETVERMSRISGDLQEIILNMRMMPVEQVFNRFPRMVRSLSRDLGKKIDLEIIGADTELDRTIIDEIGDPLVHLIRNSIDHGIETPDVRLQRGKPETGKVILRAFHSGNHVFIEIEDDGGGMDKDKILTKAYDKGIVSEEDIENMTDKQIYSLLFASGFSTADKVTDVSGRGVGLDVVRNTFESLGGIVSVDSTPGKGSIFSIQLPLTLSIIDVMLTEIQDEKYAIPLSSIVETAIVNKDEVYSAHNQKVIDFRGKVVPLVFLQETFEVPGEPKDESFYSLVIVHKGDKVAGLVVDSLIGQHDIVLKSLGGYLSHVFAISGATILGDGQVALIVDTNALIK